MQLSEIEGTISGLLGVILMKFFTLCFTLSNTGCEDSQHDEHDAEPGQRLAFILQDDDDDVVD